MRDVEWNLIRGSLGCYSVIYIYGWCKEAPCPIHFTFFVKWVGDHEPYASE
jgi:hypothetical protein